MWILDGIIVIGLVIVFVRYRNLEKPTFVTIIWSLMTVSALANVVELIVLRRANVTGNYNVFNAYYVWVTYPLYAL